ncbi:DUF11 domain-containing protein, partial [Patescibacteria group bacterium]|nr:DUF11 domain-containing protein [Patescibacteria group bacterium]
GDGIVNATSGEYCDEGVGNSDDPDAICRTDCSPQRCGDSITDTGEECDDGNADDTDGCLATCDLSECQDLDDNDSDGVTDYPDDPGCSNPEDNDESDGTTECQDGEDNDSDGYTDYPDDPGCDSPQDDDESNAPFADLMISKSGPSSVNHSSQISYTLTIENLGLYTANNIVVSDTIPSNLSFNAGASDPGCVQQSSDVLCNNLTLASGASGSYTVVFDILPSTVCDALIENQAAVSTSSTDPNPLNNQSQIVYTTVTCTQCQDSEDNDDDGVTDLDDPGCENEQDDDESDGTTECQDTEDNDGDSLTDAQDPGCWTDPFDPETYDPTDDDETHDVLCGDGVVESPEQCDEGAGNSNDPDATCRTDCTSQRCGDSITDAGEECDDGNTDDADGCIAICELSQCQDEDDNDGDGVTDYPDDPGCNSPQDDDESDGTTECQDGEDNDSDGYTDYPDDPGCDSPQDDDESNEPFADLSVSKSGPASANHSSQISYTLTALNAGPYTATNVVIADTIPANLSFNAGASDPGCVEQGTDILCNNLELASGASGSYVVVFDILETTICDATIENQASVSASSTDPNPLNNQSQIVYTTVTCTQCQDVEDNDSDGVIDLDDPGCTDELDDDESDGTTECQDLEDNDLDGLTDFPEDPGCSSPQDDDESDGTSECQDSEDNDLDGLTDYPEDPGCDSPQDDNESDGTTQCQDSEDNDQDGLTDYPEDPGCDSPQDDDESDGTTECQDGEDNDLDGFTDMDDPGCDSPQDDDESDGTSECQDGEDNDDDGLVDHPEDPGCDSPQDDDEEDDEAHTDLEIEKSGPVVATPGGTVVYTLLVTNNGPDAATNVVSVDTIPAGLTFNAGASDPECIEQGGDIFCNNLQLASGATGSYIVAFDVPVDAVCDSVIENSASVSTSSTDPNPDNNQSGIVSTTVECPPQPQCSDEIDNDGDGLTDHPEDPGCSSPQDDTETDPDGPECDNGKDDDSDGAVDSDDPGCDGPTDDDESNEIGTPSCRGKLATIYVNAQGIIVGGQDDGEEYDGKLDGTFGDDVIVGTDGDDKIDGESGDDVICGGEGNDDIQGDTGDDLIDGGPGDDEIQGDAGRDVVFGGEGNDEIQGDSGADLLCGDEGDDKIEGNSDNDVIDGGEGDDKLEGDSGNDGINGNDGNDEIDGGTDNDLCSIGDDNDSCETEAHLLVPVCETGELFITTTGSDIQEVEIPVEITEPTVEEDIVITEEEVMETTVEEEVIEVGEPAEDEESEEDEEDSQDESIDESPEEEPTSNTEHRSSGAESEESEEPVMETTVEEDVEEVVEEEVVEEEVVEEEVEEEVLVPFSYSCSDGLLHLDTSLQSRPSLALVREQSGVSSVLKKLENKVTSIALNTDGEIYALAVVPGSTEGTIVKLEQDGSVTEVTETDLPSATT